ncbi:cation:proton antiporter subunit A [Anaplasma platys]|uniref:Cation:proton antiporter subunit A n=1 Tax=Anaplasma platys TaxID=949 RepID=A0A858PXJ5_9RICK|nr:cation:proton antiporter subunit A [Anaplasma platys]
MLLLPFVSSALILGFRRVPHSQEVLSILASTVLFPVAAYLGFRAINGAPSGLLKYNLSSKLTLAFAPEAFGVVFSILVSLLWVITNIYTIGYMNNVYGKGNDRSVFYACFAASIGCTMCIAFAANIATIFIFYEMLTLCTYPLITHGRSQKALESGSAYIKTLLCSSVLLFLPLVVLVCSVSPAELFSSDYLVAEKRPDLIPLLSVLLCYGVAKAAIMPLHTWLPRAMVAATPVSALLHAVAVVKSGVFTIAKITVYALGVQGMYNICNSANGAVNSGTLHVNVLMYASIATILLGSLCAIAQTNLKKLLAYSTISQLSYITLAISLYTDGAMSAALLQMVGHAFAKITLFFAVGAIYASTGRTMISELTGLGKAMPLTLAMFSLGAFAMIGIPPAGTIWGKFYILSEALRQDNYLVVGTVLLSTLLNTLYFIPLIFRAFFIKGEDVSVIKEAPLPLLLAMLATSLGTLFLFFKPDAVSGVMATVGTQIHF